MRRCVQDKIEELQAAVNNMMEETAQLATQNTQAEGELQVGGLCPGPSWCPAAGRHCRVNGRGNARLHTTWCAAGSVWWSFTGSGIWPACGMPAKGRRWSSTG